MPPPGSGKRKRGDRSWSGDQSHDAQRPSPHRPGNLSLAQQNHGQHQEHRGRGGRRVSRGARGGNHQRSPTTPSNQPSLPTTIPPPALNQRSNETSQQPEVSVTSVLNSTPLRLPSPETRASSPYDYEYITNDVVQDWASTGRQQLVATSKAVGTEDDVLKLSAVFQELIRSVLDTRISPEQAGEAIGDILRSGEKGNGTVNTISDKLADAPNEARDLFLDTVTILTDDDTLNPRLPHFLAATEIPTHILRKELEAPLLQKVGLIRDTFARMGIRKQTNLLYRQANFNLLREESEGFAKLMTELFTTSDSEPPTNEVIEETVLRVKAMIGAFDLDVGRTLDVVLDVFGAVLVKQYRFFVKFLRASPWWPRDDLYCREDSLQFKIGGLPSWANPGFSGLSDEQKLELQQLVERRNSTFWKRAQEVGLQAWYEIGQRHISDAEKERMLHGLSPEKVEADPLLDWIQRTGTTPPKGNRDAAQLLGFKLRYYSSSSARNPTENLPDNLIYLSALLIKIGFISLKDLYPHVWRSDETMNILQSEKGQEKVERDRAARPGASAKNALLMAGALSDDTIPVPSRLREIDGRASTPSKESDGQKTATTSTDNSSSLPEAADQKAPLLKSLLAIGALPESLYILGRFPWLLDLYPELPEYLHRIIHHSLNKVYESIKPLPDRPSLRIQKHVVETDVPGIPKGQIKLSNAAPRRTLRWANLDRDDYGIEGTDYRFYWDDWSDEIPVCQSVNDVFSLCETLLSLAGVKIGQDPCLLSKLARIGKHSLSEDSSERNMTRWLDLCKRLLVPALSLTKSNPGVVNEIYDLLKNCSRETRFSIYAEWSSGRMSRNADVRSAFDFAKAETRDALKRLSKTNTKPIARTLARIACANPQVVTTVAIGQIEAYENLAEVFVEGARYFTDMGYDVLTWCLINSLGRAGRSRVQESGLMTSRWLAALAHFASRAFKRYSVLDPTPILQYVANQLKNGNSTDLILLEQIILSMAGIVTDTSYNETQILAMGGGEVLQSQTMLQLLDKRHESKITSRRLIRSLKTSGLAGQLLVSIAQERRTCIFKDEDMDAPLKLLGNLFDEIHRVLTQYLDLLRSNISLEEFQSLIPRVDELILEFGVQPEIAFWISRPTIVLHMAEADKVAKEAVEKKKLEEQASSDSSGDIPMVNGEVEEPREDGEAEGDIQVIDSPAAGEPNGVTIDALEPQHSQTSTASMAHSETYHWHPTLQSIMESLRPRIGSDITEIVGLPFYVTFWQLALYDVLIPSKAYEDELSRQHKQMSQVGSNRADISVNATRKKEEEKKSISELIDKLLAENRQHLKAFQEFKVRFRREKDHWFPDMWGKYENLNMALMEQCFLPRILLSPLDAVYCFKLLRMMHSNGTRNFRTLAFLDQLFRENRLTSLIFMCTSKEADNLGRFLMELLRDLNRWHEKKTVYEKEVFGLSRSLPGFARRLNAGGKPEEFLNYEDFRRILYKWHQLLHLALKTCFASTEYMHIRNAISVLKAICPQFPMVNWMGESFKQLVGDLGKSEQGDIKVPSLALMGELNRREKSWVMPQAFRRGQEQNDSAGSISRPGSTKPLNAEAAEFRPTKPPTVSEEPIMPKSIVTGAEDGEVQDAEMTEADAKPIEPNEAIGVGVSSQATQDLVATVSSQPRDPPVQPAKPNATSESRNAADEKTPSASRPATPHHTVPKKPEPIRPPAPSSVAHHPSLPSRPENAPSGRLPPTPIRPPGQSSDRRDLRSQERERLPRRRDHESSDDLDHHPRGYDRPKDATSHEYARHDVRERDVSSRLADDRYLHSSTRESRPPLPDVSAAERQNRSRLPSESYMSRERDRTRDSSDYSSRTTPTQSSDGPGINPARAAMINGASDRPEMSIKGQADRPRPSRDFSPTRRSEREARFDRREDVAHAGRRQPSPDQRENFPSGPRYPTDRSENARHQPPRLREIDMNHGRLNQESLDPSSGPRPRSSGPNRGRGAAPPQPHINTQQAAPTAESSVGPGLNRPTRSSSLSDSNQATPADAVGIHPDRLRNLQSPSSENSSMRPPPVQNRSLPPTPLQSSPPSAPSGPRGAPSSGPSPTSRGPPSGPTFDTSSRGNRGNRNPLAAVNSHLQQANQGSNGDRGQGMTIRGRGGLRNASASTHSTPPSPVNGPGPRSEALSSAVSAPPPRQELFPGRGQTSANTPSSNMPPPRHDDTRHPAPRVGPGSYGDDRRFDPQQEGNVPPPRMPQSSRRSDHGDENAYSGRRPTRHSSSSRTDDMEQDGSKRGHGQDDSRRPYERETGYHDRDREGRSDYGRDRDRTHDGHRDMREPPLRSMRRDDGGGPASQPTPYPPSDRGRGDNRGYGPGRPSGDERELRSRDREPREPRDLRSGGRSDRDYGGRMSDNPNTVTPQKRRGPEDTSESGGYGGGDSRMGRGGMYRNSSDGKRPRRGP